jgi:hypothetical protein
VDIEAPSPEALRSMSRSRPPATDSLQRAALPGLPTPPSLEVIRGHDTATQTDISVSDVAAARASRQPLTPRAQADAFKRWTIIAAVVACALLLALLAMVANQ